MRGPSSGAVRSAHSTSGRPHHCASSLGDPTGSRRLRRARSCRWVSCSDCLQAACDERRHDGALPRALGVARAGRRAGRPDRARRGMLATPPAATSDLAADPRGGDADEREREGPALAEAQVDGGVGRCREPTAVTISPTSRSSSDRFSLGRPAVQVEQRELALAVAPTARARWRRRPQRRREVGRVRRDAVAGLQVVLAVVADLRVAGVAAAEPAVPLDAAVVPAARVLAEVAADRALVAQERRGRQRRRLMTAAHGASASLPATSASVDGAADRVRPSPWPR